MTVGIPWTFIDTSEQHVNQSMGLFKNLFKSKPAEPSFQVADDAIVAPANGNIIDITTVSDPMFAQKLMGESLAFEYPEDEVTICAPANGKLTVMFPTGHAFGLTLNNGVELLVHIGINTVESNGEGFTTLKKQGDVVKAGQPIVKVNQKVLSKKYDMPVMLIVTNPNGQEFKFKDPGAIELGASILC